MTCQAVTWVTVVPLVTLQCIKNWVTVICFTGLFLWIGRLPCHLKWFTTTGEKDKADNSETNVSNFVSLICDKNLTVSCIFPFLRYFWMKIIKIMNIMKVSVICGNVTAHYQYSILVFPYAHCGVNFNLKHKNKNN